VYKEREEYGKSGKEGIEKLGREDRAALLSKCRGRNGPRCKECLGQEMRAGRQKLVQPRQESKRIPQKKERGNGRRRQIREQTEEGMAGN